MPRASGRKSHPTFPKMIIEAVQKISGKVSRTSICKFITKKYGIDLSCPDLKQAMNDNLDLVLKLGMLRRRRSHQEWCYLTPSAGEFKKTSDISGSRLFIPRLTVFQSVQYWPETYASTRKIRSDLLIRKPTYLMKQTTKAVVENTKSQLETASNQGLPNTSSYPTKKDDKPQKMSPKRTAFKYKDLGEPVCTSTPKKPKSFKRLRQETEQEDSATQPLAKRILNINAEINVTKGVLVKSTKTDIELSNAIDLKMRVKSARVFDIFTQAEKSDKENVL